MQVINEVVWLTNIVPGLGVGDSVASGHIFDDSEEKDEGYDHLEIVSQTNESFDASYTDDISSEQSWMLRSLSDSSVACVTSHYAMQNSILHIGFCLLAPGGMQICQLHRWMLKCHACNQVTVEIGKIFCPQCGNGGTLRKVAVTVGENGIVLAARPKTVGILRSVLCVLCSRRKSKRMLKSKKTWSGLWSFKAVQQTSSMPAVIFLCWLYLQTK